MSPSCWKCGACALPPDLSAPDVPPPPPSPDLIQLLATNDVPRSSEIPSVLAGLSKARDHLDILEAHIERVNGHIKRAETHIDDLEAYIQRTKDVRRPLIRQRDDVVELVAAHKAILSPVRRVPPEILCEIFVLTLPWSMERHFRGENVLQPPWPLALVCRAWRQTAIGYPALWQDITLTQSRCLPVTKRYPLSMMEATLQRSANLPLHITIAFDSWTPAPGDYHCIVDSRWVEELTRHAHRWGSLHIRDLALHSDYIRAILSGIKGKLARLETLRVDILHATSGSQSDCFAVAPALRTVIAPNFVGCNPRRLDINRLPEDFPLALPWHQIIGYHGVFTPKQHFQILVAAPNLGRARLGFYRCQDEWEDMRDNSEYFDRLLSAEPQATLPALQRLQLKMPKLLDHLTLPGLQVLVLCHSAEPVPSLVQRSSCCLTTLVLIKCAITTTFPNILQSVPNLECLLLDVDEESSWRGHAAKIIAEAMTVSGSPSDLCPRLTSLMCGRGWFSWGVNEMTSMLRSRLTSAPPARLTLIRVFRSALPSTTTYYVHEDMCPFRALIDEGFDVAYVSGDLGLDSVVGMEDLSSPNPHAGMYAAAAEDYSWSPWGEIDDNWAGLKYD
ncbi:hypothetical protein B0H15DRAFT_908590 [Mycena belliarum]|uniref:F-box domain-containing protein n=1 Tax=Mycena belliarum TaxID=1033014 RepID=A0AAD6U7Y2_9AGAR|nr:hypothetical protein B0H15DRAFT_908590 [Mycena belliae]